MLDLHFLKRRARRRIRHAADRARDSKQYARAAGLYEDLLRHRPRDGGLHVQCGHMFKEAGELDRAEQHYNMANRLMPDDGDLALQLGHFYKISGRFDEAETAYRKAVDLAPDNPETTLQLAYFYRVTGRLDEAETFFRKAANLVPGWTEPGDELANLPNLRGHSLLMLQPVHLPLLSSLAAAEPSSLLRHHTDRIALKQFGRWQRTAWGTQITLRGVQAVRGFCISTAPVTGLSLTLNGRIFHTEGPLKAHPLKYANDPQKRKYVFNVWYDFGTFTPGRYVFELHLACENGKAHRYRDVIVIDEPLSTDRYPNSDQLVAGALDDDRPLDEQINTRPSVIREPRRSFLAKPQRVLVVRADQLGDMVTSIPAIQRIRQLLPQAHIVGLLSPAGCELAERLRLFDNIVTVSFNEDEWEQRRVLSPEQQRDLRQQLSQFAFDLAIDLSISGDSRPLLALSGARQTIGYSDDRRAPWLSAAIGIAANDPVTGLCGLSHSAQVSAIVEYLGVLLAGHSQIIRRGDLTRNRLTGYGLDTADRFVVLHSGARLKFSRWPHYETLASRLLEQTSLKVIMMTDDPSKRDNLPGQLATSGRFQLLDRRLPFDDFDAMLSFCSVFVGNDSGPSHLASLRGIPVVNLFMARHAWSEWGHENRGYIISRRVPCAGCNIHYEPEECNKGFACITNITVDEVFDTVMKLLPDGTGDQSLDIRRDLRA